jgi:hypothetical protein
MRVGGQLHGPAALPPGKRPGTHFIRGWVGPVWTGTENLVPTGIRSPDRLTRSESLYRLRYPGPQGREILRFAAVFVGEVKAIIIRGKGLPSIRFAGKY